MIFSPKEATEMSRDIKYIGMDVHKEAIVIAVLNGSGLAQPNPLNDSSGCPAQASLGRGFRECELSA